MANKVITILKCDNCTKGIVHVIVKNVKGGIDVTVEKCDSCGKSFGIDSVRSLEKIGE